MILQCKRQSRHNALATEDGGYAKAALEVLLPMANGQDMALIEDDALAHHSGGCCDAERGEPLGGDDGCSLVAGGVGERGELGGGEG